MISGHINAFVERPTAPTLEDLSAALGTAKKAWDQLLAELAAEQDIVTQEWQSYSPKAGWALRLKWGTRTILYLAPYRGCFLVSFALGAKAVQAAREAKLPKRVLNSIDEAKKYAEGTAVRLIVAAARDIPAVKKLASIKIEN
jgi:hypothetical protein